MDNESTQEIFQFISPAEIYLCNVARPGSDLFDEGHKIQPKPRRREFFLARRPPTRRETKTRERNSGMTRTNLLIARNELRMIQLHSLQGEKVLRVEGQEQ